MENDLERRSLEAVELRLAGGDPQKPAVLSGYAAVFNSLSGELGSGNRRFREQIAPGAFRAALLAADNTFAYYHHGVAGGAGMGSAMPLGSTRDGSLRLSEDGRGLRFELDLPDTTEGRDLATMVQRGTVRGVSFAFPTRGVKDTWGRGTDGVMVRTIHEVPRVLDVSPTHMPAYEDTALAVRSLEAWEQQAETESRALNGDGEISFEQMVGAVYAGFSKLFGIDDWDWCLLATFPSAAVIRRGRRFLSYPVTWNGREAVITDSPTEVQQIYEPRAGAGWDVAGRARRLRLAEVEAGISLTPGPASS